jgi:predicted O-linked N-acetylglucosamine transferase (SPINDLY family)
LILKARALASSIAKQRVVELFKRYDIESDRLTIIGWTEYSKRHQVIQDADVALDSFPYHGTTTTCEALWAGVPWITLAGRTHVSRVGVSILSNVGLQELIANSESEYMEKAVALACDPSRLASLRGSMRERMRASPLLQRDTFARKLETAYRDMWRRWCAA